MLRVGQLVAFFVMWSAVFCSQPLHAEWELPITLSFNSTEQSASIDDTGSGFVVYTLQNGNNSEIWAARISSGQYLNSSQFPYALTTADSYQVDMPHVHVAASGNAVATWREFKSSVGYQCVASIYTEGVWTTPIVVSDTATKSITSFGAACAGNGDVCVVWVELGDGFSIKSKKYSGGIWAEAVTVHSTLYVPTEPLVLSTPAGYHIVWGETGKGPVIIAQLIDDTWAKTTIETSTITVSVPPIAAAVNALGNISILWLQEQKEIRAAHFSQGVLSPVEVVVASNEGIPSKLDIALDDDGSAIATWVAFSEDGQTATLKTAYYVAGSWYPPIMQLESPGTSMNYSKIMTGPNGKALLVYDYDHQIYAKTMNSDKSWQGPLVISTSPVADYYPRYVLAKSAGGLVMAAWINVYTAASPEVQVTFGVNLFEAN